MTSAAMHIARTGLDAQDKRMQVISNNLANVNTTAFKKARADFATLAYQVVTTPGANSTQDSQYATGLNLGTGVKIQGTSRIDTTGEMNQTGNSLDMAIDGNGYFQIQMPDGTLAYTRAGNFSTDDQGRLVTQDGYLVQPNITIPQGTTSVTISKDGQVQVTTSGNTQTQTLGQLEIATFPNEAGLDAQGDNLFMESAASGAPNVSTPGDTGFGTLLQHYTESSNVDAVSEITALIVAQRAYEMNSKVVTTADSMLQTTSQLARG